MIAHGYKGDSVMPGDHDELRSAQIEKSSRPLGKTRDSHDASGSGLWSDFIKNDSADIFNLYFLSCFQGFAWHFIRSKKRTCEIWRKTSQQGNKPRARKWYSSRLQEKWA